MIRRLFVWMRRHLMYRFGPADQRYYWTKEWQDWKWAAISPGEGVYNVKDFGAVGDGRVVDGKIEGTDDLAAFNACRDRASASGVPMYIPAV